MKIWTFSTRISKFRRYIGILRKTDIKTQNSSCLLSLRFWQKKKYFWAIFYLKISDAHAASAFVILTRRVQHFHNIIRGSKKKEIKCRTRRAKISQQMVHHIKVGEENWFPDLNGIKLDENRATKHLSTPLNLMFCICTVQMQQQQVQIQIQIWMDDGKYKIFQ